MLLFDLDGTLIDSNGIWEAIDLAFLGRHGLTPTEEYAHTVGHSIFPVAAVFTRDYYHLDLTPEAIMEEWMAQARSAYAQVDMKPGALAYLNRCRDRGETMALVTACVPELCRAALVRHGLEPFFTDLIFAQELGLEKRDPQVFRLAAERLGVSPEDCVLYEDAPHNCTAAQAAGMKAIGVYDPFYAKFRDQMRRSCDGYITSFLELL